MLIDRRRGRPLELTYDVDKIIEYADRSHVAVPYNREIKSRLREIARGAA